MDFKARFAGKTAKITKDGDLEGNKAGFDARGNAVLGNKSRGNSIHKNDRLPQDANLNITRNSKFSYKGSEQSAIKGREKPNNVAASNQSFISKPIKKLQQLGSSKEFDYSQSKQDTYGDPRADQPTEKPEPRQQQPVARAKPPSVGGGSSKSQKREPRSFQKVPQMSHSGNNYYSDNRIEAPNTGADLARQRSNNYQPDDKFWQNGSEIEPEFTPARTEEVQANVYLNGGRNMAEAIRQSHTEPQGYQPLEQGPTSIAMRMKQNRQQYGGPPNVQSGSLYSQNQAAPRSYAQMNTEKLNDEIIVHQASGITKIRAQDILMSPTDNKAPSQRVHMISNMNHKQANPMFASGGISQMSGGKPPSQGSTSHHKMLRESREKERHQHLAKVSKQIVSPEPVGYQKARPPLAGQQQFSIGLPPSGVNGTPQRRKGKGADSEPEDSEPRTRKMSAKRSKPQDIKVLRQPIKPPSNYSRGGRHQSQHRAAASKAVPVIPANKIKRDRSQDRLTRSEPPADEIGQGQQSHQQQLQAQLALMQDQMQLIQQQQQMAQIGMPIAPGQLPATPLYNPPQGYAQGPPHAQMPANLLPQNPHSQHQQFSSMYSHHQTGQAPDNFKVKIPMTNTNYDQIAPNPIYQSAQDKMETQSAAASATSSVRRNSKYRKYGQKDYNQLKENEQKTKLGGLGPNIGGAAWEVAKRKKEISQQYANNLKEMNSHQQKQIPAKRPQEREKTAREKALEFAKNNVPRPRIKTEVVKPERTPSQGAPSQTPNTSQRDLEHQQQAVYQQNYNEFEQQQDTNDHEDLPYYGSTGGGAEPNTLQNLAEKHDQYADEIEKIKAMLAE